MSRDFRILLSPLTSGIDSNYVNKVMQTSYSQNTRYYCAAVGCFSDTKKVGKYGYMNDVTFFAFPTEKKDPKARRTWLNLLRRENYNDPPRNHRLCSRHFVDGKPTVTHPYPTLFGYNNYKEAKDPRQTTSIAKRVYPVDSCTQVSETGDGGSQDRHGSFISQTVKSDREDGFPLPVVHEEIIEFSDEVYDYSTRPSASVPDHEYSLQKTDKTEYSQQDMSTQTDISMEDISRLLLLEKKCEDPNTLLKESFIRKVTETDASVMQYTGVQTKSMLMGMFGILDRASTSIHYWSGQSSANEPDNPTDSSHTNNQGKKRGPSRKLSKYEEFIMTLVRLRLALFTFFLADIFGVSTTRVSQICITYVNLMYNVFTPLLIWPSSKVVKKFSPKSFKLAFPNTVCIIDCTEFFIQKPRSPTAQSKTYSTYKHHNTFKSLIGISPSGAIIFVSNLWGGNTSDRFITKSCGFLNHVQPGDEIMADRGFVIRDLLLKKKAKLVIPPFTAPCKWGKGRRLAQRDIARTKCIARMRIHVERAIERLKNFHILGNIMPLTLKPMANQILRVCAFLCNLQKPLVKK